MIIRVWKTKVHAARVDELEQFARDHSLPMFHEQEGCLGVLFAREGADVVAVSLWEDMEAIDRLATSTSYQATVRQIEGTGLLEDDQEVSLHSVYGGYLNLREVEEALSFEAR